MIMIIREKDSLKEGELEDLKTNGGSLTYWECLERFRVSDQELISLVSKIEKILKLKLAPDSIELFSRLIVILREKSLIEANILTNDDMKRELAKIEAPLKKLVENLDMSRALRMRFDGHMIREKLLDNMDPIYMTYLHGSNLLKLCEKVKDGIKPQKKQMSLNHVRQIVANEIAREMDRLGVMPTKSRNGKFDKVFRDIIKNVPCTVNGEKISIAIPEDTFPILSEAIDKYPHEDMFFALKLI